jgi:hypothetical protein
MEHIKEPIFKYVFKESNNFMKRGDINFVPIGNV